MTRCNYIILNKDSRRYCKNFSKYVINLNGNINLCQVHGYKLINRYATIIQKRFKGNRVRYKLKLFVKLPDDIQRRIIFFMREPLYLKRVYILCRNFVYKRVNNLNAIINFSKIMYTRYEDIYRYLDNTSIIKLNHTLYLVNKYSKILNNKQILHSINLLCNELQKIFLQCVTKNNIDNYIIWNNIINNIRKYKKGIK